MPSIPPLLTDVAAQVKQGTSRVETVRTLLSWFDSQRRGIWVVQNIQEALSALGIRTEPDFALTYLDAEVTFLPLSPPHLVESAPKDLKQLSNPAEDTLPTPNQVSNPSKHLPDAADPVPRLGLLRAASRTPATVSRDTTIKEAVTLMLANDFSQLPVINGRTIVGIFSWKTYGEALTLGRECVFVRDCLNPRPLVLPPEIALLDAVGQVAANDVALVYSEGKLRGIVTTSDLSLEFHTATRPFLLLASIENNLRAIIARFDLKVLQDAKDPTDEARKINGPGDLTFGEYVRILQREENWNQVAPKLDRAVIVGQLEKVRKIRNDVMHFHPDPVDEEKLSYLDNVLRVLHMLRDSSKAGDKAKP